jgi:hypothetical protein
MDFLGKIDSSNFRLVLVRQAGKVRENDGRLRRRFHGVVQVPVDMPDKSYSAHELGACRRRWQEYPTVEFTHSVEYEKFKDGKKLRKAFVFPVVISPLTVIKLWIKNGVANILIELYGCYA